METDEDTLQDEIAAWIIKGFGPRAEIGTTELLLQAFEKSTYSVEELGEVARAIAKSQLSARC